MWLPRSSLGVPSVLIFGFVGLSCILGFGSYAQLLPDNEVQALRAISSRLPNGIWRNVSPASCTQPRSLNITIVPYDIMSNVTCDCSFSNNNRCHVVTIGLKGLNLTGEFPAEFANFTRLKEIDLTRNYVNGSIPTSITKLPLVIFSVLGNRLSGSIPKEIGDIATLEELVLEDNDFGGALPQNLGKLSRLRRLLLSSNNFTGRIPETFGNLKNLTDFRIDGSSLAGKIPGFIGNWTNLTRLYLQGTSMEGPIPSTISLLKNMAELRISDLKGPGSVFPDLKDMKKMKRLLLRNCSFTGSIPDYVGEMTGLKTLDLSFNRLTGVIPATIESLGGLDHLYLNNNLLRGSVPSWILNNKNNIDISYNNFSGLPPFSCTQSDVNLISSFSPSGSDFIDSWCLKKDLPCPRKHRYHSLFINCGGTRMEYEDNEYEEDLNTKGPSTFASFSDKWGYSSTGVFTGNEKANYIVRQPPFRLNITGEDYYKSARIAPQSLKYYGLCLLRGSYTVRLHFAEIMFSNDQTYSSLGIRVFDVSIQGKVVLKDFNIAEAAKGVYKPITMTFNNVTVEGSTLEIHLYWTGKGTTAIPDRGVYGPLISAISVTPNFHVGTGGLSAGTIAGIVIGTCAVVILLLAVLYIRYLKRKNAEDSELRGLDLQTGYFSLRQIKAATDNFSPANKIGEGGFGPVYKGVLPDGKIIAVKQLSSKSKQGNREFVNEIGMISALQHPNLVKLYGCCIEGNQLLLIYEYLENNSLARALFGQEEQKLNLDWKTRKKICLEIARGLAYLHEESRLKIVHRDIKATNVLLDKDLNAKISDFGLAKLDEEENTHISTRIAGTVGYMAPEYAMRGYLTDKADVYSFGIVALEIVSGKSNTNYRPKEEFVYLLDWAYVLEEQGNLLELVDPSLGSKYNAQEVMTMLNMALLCTNPSPTLRPTMSSVVSMLDGQTPVQAPKIKRTSSGDVMRFKAFEKLTHDSQTFTSSASQESRAQKSMSMDGPWIDSSISIESKDEALTASSTRNLL